MYVLDRERQVTMIEEMTQLRKNSQSWEVYYHHPSTNAMWKSYFPRATKNERGPKILRIEPVADELEERLANCLVEPEEENAAGLGIELSTQPENWEQVMDILNQNYRRYHRKQLPIFLKHLGVEQYESLFKDIKYSIEDGNFSKEKFDELAYASKKIRFKRFWFF